MLPKTYPVTCHTNHVGPGSTFVAIKGFELDGHNYIQKAIDLGAKKIVLEKKYKDISQNPKIEFIWVDNVRKALANLSSIALDKPCSKLKIIGITGTKGKTTTTYLTEHILRQAGFKTALIGTIKNKILDQEIESINTTPESDYLQMFLAQCVKKNVDFVVMEVSSHSLSLHRVHGIKFNIVGFTNLAPEHLDFYKTIEKYFQAKSILFNQVKKNGSIVINLNDEWGKRALQNLEQKAITFNHKNLKQNFKNPNLIGKFNKYNITMSFLICKQLGLETTKINNAINNFAGAPGRMQLHTLKNGAKVFVDYAHNPSSMQAVLQTLRPITKNLIVIFGCGGDRDKTKRPVMGKIASAYADKIIVTDDNPRFEEPEKIIIDILSGIKKKDSKKVFTQIDRRKAIEKAVELADKNSIIALLGKGHENYYLVKNKKFYFDDFMEVSKF